MEGSAGFFRRNGIKATLLLTPEEQLVFSGRTISVSMPRAQSHSLELQSDLDISSAFDAGNYVAVALEGTPSDWRWHAARGLLVDPLWAIEQLRGFDHSDACFYRAVLAWLNGDEEAATRGLEQTPGEHAANLLRLIRKPRIEVLIQLPPQGDGESVLLDGIASDRKFCVRNIGASPQDPRNSPYTPLSGYFDAAFPPDYFVCWNSEWPNGAPGDLGDVPFPTIGCTNECDAHILTTLPWLRAFDIVMICSHDLEWKGVCSLFSGAVYTYPPVFGIPRSLPPHQRRERDIDVLMTGPLVSAYHPETARLITQLLSCDDINLLLFDGHLEPREFSELSARAKITLCFCRHPGASLTMAVESLSLGGVVLVPDGHVIRLWGGEEQGIFAFANDPGPLDIIRRILQQPQGHILACEANASTIRESFSAAQIASRFFRFCAVTATKPGRRRLLELNTGPIQKRQVLIRGPRPDLPIAQRLGSSNINHLRGLDAEHPSMEHKNDIAREIALPRAHARPLDGPPADDRKLHLEMIQNLGDAIEAAPLRLVLHFNLLRLLIHFGNPEEFDRGLKLAADVIVRPADQWRIDPPGDTLPYDLPGDWFNSRGYFDFLVKIMAGDVIDAEPLRRLILASIHHYLSVAKESLAHAESACTLDPEFPIYRLHLAELLSQNPDAGQLQYARSLLMPLTDSSFVAWKAFRLINAINERLGEAPPETAILGKRMAAARSSLIVHGDHGEPSSFVHYAPLRSNKESSWTIHKTAHRQHAPRLSIIVCGQAGYGCGAILSALAHQTAARALFEVIYVECFHGIAPSLLELADTVISCDQGQFFEHRGVALNIAAGLARSDVMAVVEPGVAPDEHFVERILSGFFRVADEPVDKPAGLKRIALVGGWTEHSAASFRFVVLSKADFNRTRHFDEHEIFAGDSASVLDLLWRLQLAGIPVFDAGTDELVLITLPPWWELPLFAERLLVLSACRLIWPQLCEENRIEPLLVSPLLKESSPNNEGVETILQHEGYNLLRCGVRNIAVRQSLGPVDPSLSTEELAGRYGTTDVIVRDTLDGVIHAIDLVINKERVFSFRSSYVRYQVRKAKCLFAGKVRRLGFRIDDPNSLPGRFKILVNRMLP